VVTRLWTLAAITVIGTACGGSTEPAVTRAPVAEVSISPDGAVLNGRDSVQLHAEVTDASHVQLFGRTIVWSAVDSSIASVSPTGMVHIHGLGNGRIAATSEGVTSSINIAADARLVAWITVTIDTLRLVPGAHAPPWIYHLFDQSGHELVARGITFTSLDSSIATSSWAGTDARHVGATTVVATADTASLRIPVFVATVAFTSVSVGADHVCGLTASHQAWCWGYDGLGALGTQPYVYQGDDAPAPVRGGLEFTSIAAGNNWTCALTANGTPYCWGGMDEFDHGSLVPKKISGVTLVSLSNTGPRACGLDAAGIAWCWGGSDYQGLLFIPPTGCGSDCAWTPVPVGNGTHWSALSPGVGSHLCGITTSNVAECWGWNNVGQLGDGTLVNDSLPEAMNGDQAFAQVSAGASFSCGLTPSGDAYCWGSDRYGALGTGVASPMCLENGPCVQAPAAVAGGHKFTKIGAADDHACGLTADGVVYCWGYLVNAETGPTIPSVYSAGVTFTTLDVNFLNCGFASDGKLYCIDRLNGPTPVLGQP
jgi:alpha-tubulin suppressor-like RCC1 family protein